ncbi:cell division protein SepF [Limnochorda pilosa]|uniref:Cell division protein SepF n=1 Tax=Limnochorda pilosa TaxID=1555112 RepID=A0A0K2SMP1_LIMPI|nr:cell division protein SepF [Limnochorda pilosa]BAS28375.1 cell division protein SepF [Limnochorda pilosa]
MERGFFDRVLKFMGIEQEEAASAEPARAVPEEVPYRRRGRLISLPGPGSQQMNVVVAEPTSFDEVESLAEQLKQRHPVLITLERTQGEVARRIIDFLSGATYALDGRMQKVGDWIFLFAPSNVTIDLVQRELEDRSLF